MIELRWSRVNARMKANYRLSREIKAAQRCCDDDMMMVRSRNCANLGPFVNPRHRHMALNIWQALVNVVRQCRSVGPQVDDVFNTRNIHDGKISGSFFQLSIVDYISIEISSNIGMSHS